MKPVPPLLAALSAAVVVAAVAAPAAAPRAALLRTAASTSAADTLRPSAPEAPTTLRERWRAPFAVLAEGRVAPRPERTPLVRLGTGASPATVVAAAPEPAEGGGVAAATRVHEVRPGETLYGIARRYGVALARLREANGMEEGEVLRAGATLSIPAAPARVEETRMGGV